MSVPVFALTGTAPWLKAVFAGVICFAALNGFFTVASAGFDRPRLKRALLAGGMALSIVGTALFMLARQPYAGGFFSAFW